MGDTQGYEPATDFINAFFSQVHAVWMYLTFRFGADNGHDQSSYETRGGGCQLKSCSNLSEHGDRDCNTTSEAAIFYSMPEIQLLSSYGKHLQGSNNSVTNIKLFSVALIILFRKV